MRPKRVGLRTCCLIVTVLLVIFFFIYLQLEALLNIWAKNKLAIINTFIQFKENTVAVEKDPDFSSTDNETGFPYMIVPNIIHLVHFGVPEMNFGEMITIKSAYLNHKPDRIIIHCDCEYMFGEYWEDVKKIKELEIMYMEKPEYIFGKKLSWIQHSSDVARLQVLMEYGGIYLDTDVYVVKSLDKYRKFEFTVGWDYGQYIGSQILIAHKKSRFLKLYYESFHDYQPELWYYNAGEHPTKSILYEKPHLVHRVVHDFGVAESLVKMLYVEDSDEWRNFSTIHLLLRHKHYMVKNDPVKEFNIMNIMTYNRTFGHMARLVIFGPGKIPEIWRNGH